MAKQAQKIAAPAQNSKAAQRKMAADAAKRAPVQKIATGAKTKGKLPLKGETPAAKPMAHPMAALKGIAPAAPAAKAPEAKVVPIKGGVAAALASLPSDKAPKAAKAPSGPRMHEKTRAMLDSAAKGKIPAAPDFSAETHKAWRKKLEAAVAFVKAKDAKGLKKLRDSVEPKSSSRKALCRYMDAALIAIAAKA
jgi:hypothetical protein